MRLVLSASMGCGDRRDVAGVGAAAAAEDVDPSVRRMQCGELVAELRGIAIVQLGAVIQFGMALARRVRPDSTDASETPSGADEHRVEMIGVRTIDHKVGGSAIGLVLLGELFRGEGEIHLVGRFFLTAIAGTVLFLGRGRILAAPDGEHCTAQKGQAENETTD